MQAQRADSEMRVPPAEYEASSPAAPPLVLRDLPPGPAGSAKPGQQEGPRPRCSQASEHPSGGLLSAGSEDGCSLLFEKTIQCRVLRSTQERGVPMGLACRGEPEPQGTAQI